MNLNWFENVISIIKNNLNNLGITRSNYNNYKYKKD